MFCPECGSQLPDDATFCMKCGARIGGGGGIGSESGRGVTQPTQAEAPILAPSGATSLKCPNCGAPISPQFGEMVITCEYCGSGISLGNDGWKSVQKQTMLPINFADETKVVAKIHDLMDSGLLHWHLQENSTCEDLNLTMVPY